MKKMNINVRQSAVRFNNLKIDENDEEIQQQQQFIGFKLKI